MGLDSLCLLWCCLNFPQRRALMGSFQQEEKQQEVMKHNGVCSERLKYL